MKEALTRKPDRHLRNRPIRPNRQLVDSKAASKRIRTSIHRIHLNYPDAVSVLEGRSGVSGRLAVDGPGCPLEYESMCFFPF